MRLLQDFVNTDASKIMPPDSNSFYNRLVSWCRDADENYGVIPYDIERSKVRQKGEEEALAAFQFTYEKKFGFYVPKRAIDMIVRLLKGKRVMALECNPATIAGYLVRNGIEVISFDSMEEKPILSGFDLNEVSRFCGVEPVQMKPVEALKKYGDDVDLIFYKCNDDSDNHLSEIIGAIREMGIDAPVLYIGSEWFTLLENESYFREVETYSGLNVYLIQYEYAHNNIFYRPWIIHEVMK